MNTISSFSWVFASSVRALTEGILEVGGEGEGMLKRPYGVRMGGFSWQRWISSGDDFLGSLRGKWNTLQGCQMRLVLCGSS